MILELQKIDRKESRRNVPNTIINLFDFIRLIFTLKLLSINHKRIKQIAEKVVPAFDIGRQKEYKTIK